MPQSPNEASFEDLEELDAFFDPDPEGRHPIRCLACGAFHGVLKAHYGDKIEEGSFKSVPPGREFKRYDPLVCKVCQGGLLFGRYSINHREDLDDEVIAIYRKYWRDERNNP